jgi:hypothetical protein
MEYLFRGVGIEMHNNGEGLKSKGTEFNIEGQLGDDFAMLGNGMLHGSAEVNAILAHQTDSSKYPTSGVSTTPHFERAKYYATKGGTASGIVYKIDPLKFSEFEIKIFRIKDHIPFPKIAEDDEVIILQNSGLKINEKVVIEVISIDGFIK